MPRYAANVSLLFADRPLPQRFAAAASSGFDGVEIQFPYDTALSELQQAQQRTGLPVCLINVPADDLLSGGPGLVAIPGGEARFREALSQTLDYAQALSVPSVNVLAGRALPGLSRANAWKVLVGNLRVAAEVMAEQGIRVVTEAINPMDMPGFLVNTSTHMAQLLEEVSHPNLAMQVDLYHLARMDEALEPMLTQHLPHIGHVQMADVPGRGAPGSGTLPLLACMQHLDMLGYTAWVGAEYRPGGATEDSLDWLRDWHSIGR